MNDRASDRLSVTFGFRNPERVWAIVGGEDDYTLRVVTPDGRRWLVRLHPEFDADGVLSVPHVDVTESLARGEAS